MSPNTTHWLTEHPDITPAIKTSQPVAGETAELRLAVDTIPGLRWSAMPDGHIVFLNQPWCEYTGLTLAQAAVGAGARPVTPKIFPVWKGIGASGWRPASRARWKPASSGSTENIVGSCFAPCRSETSGKISLDVSLIVDSACAPWR